MSVAYLPPSISLKSNWFNLYLNYSDDSDSSTHGLVKFNGSNFSTLAAKFEVLTSTTGPGRVHIRCRQNQKYLRRNAATDVYITPEADEPENDTSKWGCTLFEAREVAAGDSTGVYLLHVQSRYYTNAWTVGGIRFLRLNSAIPNYLGQYDILDLESMVILPKHVAFKGNSGDYLQVGATTSAHPTFTTTDKGVPETWFVTSTDGDGRVQLLSFHSNKFLRYTTAEDWIFADSDGSTTDLATMFWPTKLNSSSLALKNMSNNKFGQQYSYNGIRYGFRAVNASTNDWCRFTLVELVHSRRIFNADFDLKNAIIYGETPVSMATGDYTNNTEEDSFHTFRLEYTESKETTWTSSHSWMVGVSVSASFKIPFVGGTEVTATAEYSGSYEWGETITNTNVLETIYSITVPANSRVFVRLMATKGACDVPYSYYQRDMLYNGRSVVYKKDDGLFRGVNSYNFHYEVTTTKMLESGAELAETATVQKIPMPEFTGPTIVPIPVTSTTNLQSEE